MRMKSNYADKLCSLFKKSDCNDILESKDAEIFGAIGWSEIRTWLFHVKLVNLALVSSVHILSVSGRVFHIDACVMDIPR